MILSTNWPFLEQFFLADAIAGPVPGAAGLRRQPREITICPGVPINEQFDEQLCQC